MPPTHNAGNVSRGTPPNIRCALSMAPEHSSFVVARGEIPLFRGPRDDHMSAFQTMGDVLLNSAIGAQNFTHIMMHNRVRWRAEGTFEGHGQCTLRCEGSSCKWSHNLNGWMCPSPPFPLCPNARTMCPTGLIKCKSTLIGCSVSQRWLRRLFVEAWKTMCSSFN